MLYVNAEDSELPFHQNINTYYLFYAISKNMLIYNNNERICISSSDC